MPVNNLDIESLKSKIPGWGADLDPSRRPGIPREWNPPHKDPDAHWDKPEQQDTRGIKIHVTTERPGITPVFGTTCPPKLLSGKLRSFAYATWGEGIIRRWLVLLLADRIDMVESAITEAIKGRPDNPFTEMGLGVELREHGAGSKLRKRQRAGGAAALGGVVVAVGAAALATGLVSSLDLGRSRRESSDRRAA